MSENKYQKGKIYKITDVAYQECYFGSTIEPLTRRMIHHKHKYLHQTDGKETCIRSANAIFNKYGIENCKIELVENYPCNSKEELERREGFHIKNNSCVNKYIAGRTREEYMEDTRERKNQRQREYYYNNVPQRCAYAKQYNMLNPDKVRHRRHIYYERVKEKLSEPYLCGCGKKVQRRTQARHEKTQKHQNWLKQQQQAEQEQEETEKKQTE